MWLYIHIHRVSFLALSLSYSSNLSLSLSLSSLLCLAPLPPDGLEPSLTFNVPFFFLFARSISVSHVPSASPYYRVSRLSESRVLLFSLLSFPFSLSLVRPRPPSRPIMLPYCLGILSLTPKPVQIASRFARTCTSALLPLHVRRRSLPESTRKRSKDAYVSPTRKGQRTTIRRRVGNRNATRFAIRFANISRIVSASTFARNVRK